MRQWITSEDDPVARPVCGVDLFDSPAPDPGQPDPEREAVIFTAAAQREDGSGAWAALLYHHGEVRWTRGEFGADLDARAGYFGPNARPPEATAVEAALDLLPAPGCAVCVVYRDTRSARKRRWDEPPTLEAWLRQLPNEKRYRALRWLPATAFAGAGSDIALAAAWKLIVPDWQAPARGTHKNPGANAGVGRG